MKLHLQIAGALLIALALAHPLFDRYFGWSKETKKLCSFTRQVFHVHGFFIVVILLMMGAFSIVYDDDLLSRAPLSQAILTGFAIFWILRALTQWFVHDSSVWRGSPFRTVMHGLLSALWLYLAGIYSLAI